MMKEQKHKSQQQKKRWKNSQKGGLYGPPFCVRKNSLLTKKNTKTSHTPFQRNALRCKKQRKKNSLLQNAFQKKLADGKAHGFNRGRRSTENQKNTEYPIIYKDAMKKESPPKEDFGKGWKDNAYTA